MPRATTRSGKRKPPMRSVSRRTFAIVRASGIKPTALALSDLVWRALSAGMADRKTHSA